MSDTRSAERPKSPPAVVVPDDAGGLIRARLGFAPHDDLRISYWAGPGDVRGTFEYWRNGLLDPRVPTIAYSTMFYELCEKLGATSQVISSGEEPLPAFESGRFRFDHLVRKSTTGAFQYYWSSLRTALEARKLLFDFRPHLLVVTTNIPSFAIGIVRSVAPRIVLSAHNTYWPAGQTEYNVKDRIRLGVDRVSLSFIRAAVCTSGECARQVAHLTNDRPAIFTEIPQQRQAPPQTSGEDAVDGRVLLFLGRIEENKGIYDLLAAFSALKKKHADIRLVFAGAGTAEKALQRRIEESGLPDVSFIGRLKADEVFDTLERTHLLVCPTRSAFKEGLALVCIEAATYGVPSVMSSVVPAAELLADSAEVFPADSVDAMTSSIEKLLGDQDLWRKRSAAARNVSKIFFDRSRSWGSALFEAMLAAGERSGSSAHSAQ